MNYFSTIKFNEPMHDHLNFLTVAYSALSLFVMHTGNNFYELSTAVSLGKSVKNDCIENPTYEDYVKAGYKTVGCGN